MSPTLWTIASQAPLSMGFLRQGCWSGFPCPSPGDLPDPEINPASLKSPALACYVPLAPLGKSKNGASKSQSSENVTLLSSTQVPFVLSTSRGRVLVLCEFWLGGNSAMEYAVPGWVFGFSEGRDSTQEQQRGIPPEERVWGLLTSQQRAGQVFHPVERPRNSSGQGKQPTAVGSRRFGAGKGRGCRESGSHMRGTRLCSLKCQEREFFLGRGEPSQDFAQGSEWPRG